MFRTKWRALVGCLVLWSLLGMNCNGDVLSVGIGTGDVSMAVGESMQLSVTVAVVGKASRAVAWSSSDSGVATVSSSGLLTAVAEGVCAVEAISRADATMRDSITVTVRAAGTSNVLEPGGAVQHPSGFILLAQPDSLVDSVMIEIDAVSDPSQDAPLPVGVTMVGPAFSIVSTPAVSATPGHPFIIGIPVPENTDLDGLAIGILESRIDVRDVAPPEGDEGGTMAPSWVVLRGAFDPESSLLFAPVLALDHEGWVAALVRVDGYETVVIGDAAVSPEVAITTTPTFEGHCGPGFAAAVEDCTAADTATAAAMLERAYLELTALDFTTTPRLLQETGSWTVTGTSTWPFIAVRFVPGPYLIELRPRSTVDAGGMYSRATGSIWVAIGTAGMTEQRRPTVRHEYVHATQYGYDPVLDSTSEWLRSRWVIEGQAVLLQLGFDPVSRHQRPVRPIDDSLEESQWTGDSWRDDVGPVEYMAQDFWWYLAQRFEHDDARFMVPFMERGLRATDVDQSLRARYAAAFGGSGVDGGLARAYWEWAKNHAFTKQVGLGSTRFGSTCRFTEGSATLTELTYSDGDTIVEVTETIAPLTTHVYSVDLDAAIGTSYQATIAVETTAGAVRSAIFEGGPADPTSCFDQPDRDSLEVSVDASGTRYLVLVSNTGFAGAADHTLRVHRLVAPPDVRIEDVPEPQCVNQVITLRADVTHADHPQPFPPERLTWWIGDPAQERTGNPIDVQFDAEGVIPVRVRATDQYGQYTEDAIDLNVEHCVIARPDSATVYVLAGSIEGLFQEHTVLVDVLANDVSTAGERLSIVSVDFDDWDATSGTVDVVDLADVDRDAILYTGVAPRAFTYVVRDESDRRDTGLVTISKADPRFPTADDLLPANFFETIDCRFVPWPEWPLPCCINERDDVAWTIGSDFPQAPPFEPQTWRARISYGDGRQIDLGTLGGDRSHAHGLNDDGWVVGVSNTANGAMRAFRWSPDRGMVDLGTLAGGQGSVAMDIGNAGSVVGYTGFADGGLRATLWTNAGAIIDLGPAFHEDVRSVAMGVVDSPRWGPIVVGTVLPPVGVATADFIIVPPADIGAFMWIDADGNGLASPDEITWLPTTDDAISFATGINAALQVIGHTSVDGRQRGFVWSPGSPGLTLLEAPPETDTQLFGINRHGHVVGTIEADLSMTGTIWEAGRMRFQDDMANALSRIVRLLDLNDRGSMLGQVLDTRDSCLSPVRFLVE